MYTRERMERNLGVGNIAEAFFRYWYEQSIAPKRPDLVIAQFGYNPEGLVFGPRKVEMLKELRESPDFALFRKADLGTAHERPIIGISVNGQGDLYTMHNARAPWLCWACARRVQQECYEERIGNLWFNRYNITNDYRGFRELFDRDVVLVSVIAKWFKSVFSKVRKAGLETAALTYIKKGLGTEPSPDVKSFIDMLTQIHRGNWKVEPRKYEIRWLLHSDVYDGKIPHSVAGAPVNVGLPREVVCIDVNNARGERELVDFIVSLQSG